MSRALRVHEKHEVKYGNPLLYKAGADLLLEYLKNYNVCIAEGNGFVDGEIPLNDLKDAIFDCTDPEMKQTLEKMSLFENSEGYINFSIF